MTTSFWKTLSQPIIGLAPMDGVTDSAFRYIVATYGKLMWYLPNLRTFMTFALDG